MSNYGRWYALQASTEDGEEIVVPDRKAAGCVYLSFYRAGRGCSFRRNPDGTYTVRALGANGERYKKGPRKDLRLSKDKSGKQ